jgi:hypothetical protein
LFEYASSFEFFSLGRRKRLTKLLQFIDGSDNGGFGTEDFLLLAVEGFSLGERFFHGSDTIELLAECTEACVDEVQDVFVGGF